MGIGNFNCRWLAFGVVAVNCGSAFAGQTELMQLAQVESVQRRGPGADAPPPQPRAVEPPLPGQAPDPTGVWFYVRHRDLPRARAELERLKSENPGWRVPDDLAAAVTATATAKPKTADDQYGRRVNAAETAIRAHKPIARDLDALVESMTRRKDSGAAERLGRAFLETGAPAPADTWFDRALAWAQPGSKQQAAAAIGLVKAESQLEQWDAARDHVAALPAGDARAQAAQILSDSADTAAQSAAKAGDWPRAEYLASLAEANGPSRVRTDLGWVALDAGDTTRAAASFAMGPQTEESRYGRILALSHAAGDIGPLTISCAATDRSARAATACGDALAARALTAYEAKDWTAVIALDAAANDLGLRRSGTHLLAGWSHYRQGDYGAALKAFDDVAASEPDAVDGIVQALMATGRYAELDARAAHGNARLVAAYHRQLSSLALIRKRMILASTVSTTGTDGMDAPTATVGVVTRDKTGASGADRLAWQGLSVSTSTSVGTQRFSTGLEFGHVHIGTPATGAPIGSLQPSATAPDPGATLAMPWLRWENEGIDYAYTATVGTTPIGGRVDALPAIALTAEHDWNTVIGTAAMRVAPRYDSLLAMAGMRDGATGATWGRVVEIGPQAGAIVLLNQHLSLSASAAVTTLDGHSVVDNTHVATALSLTYELKPSGFDYVRVGPAYSFDHYQKNENFFTIGNGGYYSPDQGHSLGAFVDFLTDEGRTWQIGGRVTAAWQHSVEDAARQLPLTTSALQFPGKIQSQLGTDSVIRATALLGPHLILGAFGRVTYAPSGRDLAAGLTLTIPFSRRTAVFSSDFPHFADRSWP